MGAGARENAPNKIFATAFTLGFFRTCLQAGPHSQIYRSTSSAYLLLPLCTQPQEDTLKMRRDILFIEVLTQAEADEYCHTVQASAVTVVLHDE